jgi:SPP1 family predicted phage head-tail adaptor
LKKLIKPYELNKPLIFQAPVKVSDGAGGFTTTWLTVATAYGALWPISATEIIKSDKPTMEVSHRVRIRYRKVMKPSWRISYANRYFNIVSIINPEEANEYFDILAKEVI